jgi:hypothetical protein
MENMQNYSSNSNSYSYSMEDQQMEELVSNEDSVTLETVCVMMAEMNAATAELVTGMHQQVQIILQEVQARVLMIKEEEEQDHRLLPRRKKMKYDFKRAKLCIEKDYLGPNALFDCSTFKQIFRISRTHFEKVAQCL